MRQLSVALIAAWASLSAPARGQSIEYVGSTPWGSAQDVKVADDYAYCADDEGLVILDVSDPAQPQLVSQTYLPGRGHGLFLEGSSVYFADGDSGLYVLDISDPSRPAVTGHGRSPQKANDIFISGHIAYVADDATGLQVIDVTEPSTPTLLGTVNTPGSAEGVFVSGEVAYVADGFLGALQIINVANPTSPFVMAVFDDTLYQPSNVFVRGNYAYVADFPSDFKIVDVANPAVPTLVSRSRTCCHTYDVVPSGDFAFAVRRDYGLDILNISDPRTPSLYGQCGLQGTLSSIDLSGTHAFVAGGSAFIVDISDLASPSLAGRYSVDHDFGKVAIRSNYAYVTENDGGFSVIDISDTGNPAILSTFDTTYTYSEMYIEENRIYLGNNPIRVFDVSNPLNPVFLGSCGGPDLVYDIAVSNEYIYLASGDNGLQIIDATVPHHFQLIGQYSILNSQITDVSVRSGYAYIAHFSDLLAIDVRDPANPVMADSLEVPPWTTRTAGFGNYIFAGNIAEGHHLLIIDISQPSSPILAGDYQTYTRSFPAIFADESYLYLCRGDSGLQVLDIANPSEPVAVAAWPSPASGLSVAGEYIYLAGGALMIVRFNPTGIEENSPIPHCFSLSQNYPNPFNAKTTIRYDLPCAAEVTVDIFDLLGRKVATLWDGIRPAGDHHVTWEANGFTSGTYFYRIKAGEYVETKKMTLMK
jgi:hypothetical protein